MNAVRLIATIGLAAMVAGCAGNPRPTTPREVIDRALQQAPYAAQPSLIVAREVEYARAAREDGQWTAFRAFATDDAVLHGPIGPVAAKAWLAAQENPEEAVKWGARTVVMSCDGRLAISQGRFLDPEGFVGTYVTVWERETLDDEYQWSYDVGAHDEPQPAQEQVDEDVVVVTGIERISGLVATCPRDGMVPPPPLAPAGDASRAVEVSGDGTLRWMWEHRPDGTRHVRADYYTGGGWETVVDDTFAPSTAASAE